MTAAMVKRIGLFGGPIAGDCSVTACCPSVTRPVPASGSISPKPGRATLGLMVWMAGWWLTEAVDIEATALLPIVTFPLVGIAPLSRVLPPYAADVIFLFMGGFIIGLAIERWGLDRRIAFFISAPRRRASGRHRRRLHGGHGVLEHVGLEYRVRRHDGANRPERRRPGAAQPYRRRPEGIGGFRRIAFPSATSPPACCSASRTRHRSAGLRPSSARHPTASPCATSGRHSTRT